MPIEIPGLMQDLFNIIGKGRYFTITDANQELEDLGWGLAIMDNVTYELINSLFNKKWQTSLSQMIQSGYLCTLKPKNEKA